MREKYYGFAFAIVTVTLLYAGFYVYDRWLS